MTKESQQEQKEKVFTIKESKINYIHERLRMLHLPANMHVTIQEAFNELKKE